MVALQWQWLVWPSAAALEPGAAAPEFSLPSVLAADGRVALGDHAGKVLYVNFWSAWCAPCREALPSLVALREAYPRERFEVIGINVDPLPDAARRVLGRAGARFPNASDADAESATMYGVEAVPAAFVVGADGIVRDVRRGPLGGDITALEMRLGALIESESAQPEVRKAMSNALAAPRAPASERPGAGATAP